MSKKKDVIINEGANHLRTYSKDGDIHNYEDNPSIWKVFLWIAILGIRRFQKKAFFGKWIKWGIRLAIKRSKGWKDHHTMQYFKDFCAILRDTKLLYSYNMSTQIYASLYSSLNIQYDAVLFCIILKKLIFVVSILFIYPYKAFFYYGTLIQDYVIHISLRCFLHPLL